MLLKIGPKKHPDTVAGRLLECHDRIRAFSALPRRLAAPKEQPLAEVADAARQVRRYFTKALPMHVLDEEECILPRLRGQDEALDAALDAMHTEHELHSCRPSSSG